MTAVLLICAAFMLVLVLITLGAALYDVLDPHRPGGRS